MHSSIYGYLTVFHTIVAEGSIAGAARKLQMASPSISQSLKLLEQHVGLPLFNRTTRKMELTEAGYRLAESTREALQSLAVAVETVQDLSNIPKGVVRITVPHVAYWLLIEPRLGEFAKRFPDIQLEISINDGIVDILKDGFDLGIRFGDKIEENMVAKKLTAPLRLGIYASKAYQAKFGLPKKIEELQQHRLIGFRFTTSNRIFPLTLVNKGEDISVNMTMPMVANSLLVVKSAIEQGVGIGHHFEPLMTKNSDKSEFIPVLEKHWKTFGTLYLYYMQHSQKAGRIRAVIEFFTEVNI